MCPPGSYCTCWFFYPNFTQEQDQFIERHLRPLEAAFDGDFATEYMASLLHEWLARWPIGPPDLTADEQYQYLDRLRNESVRVQTEVIVRYYCNKQGQTRREFSEWLARGIAENLRSEFPELVPTASDSTDSAIPSPETALSTEPVVPTDSIASFPSAQTAPSTKSDQPTDDSTPSE
ncbi:hypothetical protein MD484_g6553, partial [Candolleomyces efflorescens]